jgi:hypothetical protein
MRLLYMVFLLTVLVLKANCLVYYVQKTAKQLGLVGWVMNTEQGEVHVKFRISSICCASYWNTVWLVA